MSASPDKSPSSAAGLAAHERVEAATGPPDRDPGRHADQTFARRFLEHVWSTNPVTVTALAVLLAALIGAVLIVVSDPATVAAFGYFLDRPGDALGRSAALVGEAYGNLLKGALVDPATLDRWLSGDADWRQVLYPISETLTYTTPLVFTGLAVAVAFRAGLFNIGAQGQATMGVIAAALAGFWLPLPVGLHLLVAVLAGAAGGAVWGFLPGILKARAGAHEVITTIMLNYVAFSFLTWIVHQPGVQDPGRTDFISRPVDASAQLPRLFGEPLRVDAGVVLAVAVTAGVAWLLSRSTVGFELRAVGANPDAARAAGISVAGTFVLAMTLSGALAGLGGGQAVLGATASALTPSVVAQIGFDGILVALLGRVRPWGVALAALLFGALRAGGNTMQSAAGVSLELVTVLQALIVVFIAAPALVKALFRLRAAGPGGAPTGLAKGW
ncbi:ABC transporter permease [Pilimelia columellifera]|uniref:ABC transporter permease n=1 Tax=Pilimelia columellifera subsp. columellifera TaxID=706583 RepID=A0ABN3NJN8_9ACTN